ncbi:cyclic nucleotide-binding domain-containing protein [Patescibacteria group bacterium]
MDNPNPIFNILEKIPLFKDLTEESYNLITNNITLEYYPKHHKIFSEGDPGDALYIIKRGVVRIYQGSDENPDDQVEIATLSNDTFFGEMALVSEKPRNANAMVEEEAEIFVLKKDEFKNLINENPSLAEQVSSEFIQRIKENDRNQDFQEPTENL